MAELNVNPAKFFYREVAEFIFFAPGVTKRGIKTNSGLPLLLNTDFRIFGIFTGDITCKNKIGACPA